MELRFKWDDAKEQINIRKHGIAFDDARTVFYDEHAVQFFDLDHSRGKTASFCSV